jgi:hypothetical protein
MDDSTSKADVPTRAIRVAQLGKQTKSARHLLQLPSPLRVLGVRVDDLTRALDLLVELGEIRTEA